MSRPAETPEPPASGTRPLAVLRALIDAVDHEILEALARRNGLVGEIAAYKRTHGVAIRDRQRERQIIDDRRGRAQALGLSPDQIESLVRLTLWGSRDRQAKLRAELPPETEQRTVAVIGASGQMGRLLCGLFADLGHAVMAADLDTDLSPQEAAAFADVVVISVPIEATLEVIRDIGPRVRAEALLMDVTSIKGPPVAAMLKCTKASVAGTHPLFGPSVHSLQGQRIVLCPGRGEAWLNWLAGMLRARGLTVEQTSAEEHDRAMAAVQVLTHYATEVAGAAMAELGVPLAETLRFTSPVYLMEILMTARHFAQSPDLYASIQMSNPLAGEVAAAFGRAAAAQQKRITEGDREGVRALFEHVRDYFGPFTAQALETSSFLIDRLVERSD
jgi:chorismate mutase/prephenate dehydrogenase